MKQFIITALYLLFTFSAIQAQNKIIERSAKKVPEWLKNNTDGQMWLRLQLCHCQKHKRRQ